MAWGSSQAPSFPANTGVDCHLGKVMGDSAKGGKERKEKCMCKKKDEVPQNDVFLNNTDVFVTVQILCGFWHNPSKQVN